MNFRYQRHKSMFVFFIILTIGAFSSVQFIPPISKSTQLNYHCNDGMADLKYCPTSMDHCAADLLLTNSNQPATKDYTFDVRLTLFCLSLLYGIFSKQNDLISEIF